MLLHSETETAAVRLISREEGMVGSGMYRHRYRNHDSRMSYTQNNPLETLEALSGGIYYFDRYRTLMLLPSSFLTSFSPLSFKNAL